MTNHVYWIVEGIIKEGMLEELKALSEEMISSTRMAEPKTILYEWFIGPSGKECYIHEGYADSNAAMKHLDAFNLRYAARFETLVKIERLIVFGCPSDELRKELGESGTLIPSSLGGFSR